VAVDTPTQALGVVRLDHELSWHRVLDAVPGSPITLDHPVFMEALNTRLGSGQHHGWIVYRTTLPSVAPSAASTHVLNISGTIRDRAQVQQLASSFYFLGTTEIAGVDIVARSKNAGVDIAGVDIAGVIGSRKSMCAQKSLSYTLSRPKCCSYFWLSCSL